jgi:diguanylate cyclase (GGDEF)-like protein
MVAVAMDDGDAEAPGTFYEPWLFQAMLSHLSGDELGIAFLYDLLGLLAQRHQLTDVVAVLEHDTFGTQMFRLGGRALTAQEASAFAASPGVHCVPDTVSAIECEAVLTACMLILALHVNRFNANHDALTGVENRGSFDRSLALVCGDSARYGWAFTVVLLDLDDFHDINRKRGIQHGDSVLRNLGFALRKSIRRGDTAARFGGDEFAVILKNAEGTESKGFIERLQENLQAAGHEIDFTYVDASSPQDSTDPGELVKLLGDRLNGKKGDSR